MSNILEVYPNLLSFVCKSVCSTVFELFYLTMNLNEFQDGIFPYICICQVRDDFF